MTVDSAAGAAPATAAAAERVHVRWMLPGVLAFAATVALVVVSLVSSPSWAIGRSGS